MRTPLDATRAVPITTTIHDFLVGAWLEPNAAGARSWVINVGGKEYAGPVFDDAKHGELSGLKDMLRDWAKAHPQLFT